MTTLPGVRPSRGRNVVATVAVTLLLVCGVGCAQRAAAAVQGSKGAPAALELDYRVSYSQAPHRISVEIALDGPPRDFMFTQAGQVEDVVATVGAAPQSLRVEDDGAVTLPKGTKRLRYDYVPDERRRSWSGDLYSGAGRPGSYVVAARAYLLRPRVADGVTARLAVTGARALLPWRPGPDGTWRLTGVQLVDGGFHSFGGRRCSGRVDGAELEVALHEGDRNADDAQVCAWIQSSAQEVLTVRRNFPYDRVTVHTLPGPGGEPSPLGLMLWSNPPSLALIVGRDADPSSFASDWVAVHEFLHLAHPSFMGDAPWLSEGLATYYTEVARMRAGRITSARGWRNLMEGFSRGREQADGRTLEDAVTGLRRGVYLPVYWAGAYIALELDVAIRKASGNTRTLDSVLERLAAEGQTSSVAAFGAAVDGTAGRPVFDEILRRHREDAFDGAEELLRRLGVVAQADGDVDEVVAPLSHLRDAISRGAAVAQD